MLICATPVSSSSCRVFLQYVHPKHTKSSVKTALGNLLFRPWLHHMIHNWIFDGDMVFLNAQARRVRKAEEDGKGGEYFMPVSCDVSVAAFRK